MLNRENKLLKRLSHALKGAFSISVLRFQKKDVKVAESSLSENVLDKLRNLTLIRRNAVAELVLKKDLSL